MVSILGFGVREMERQYETQLSEVGPLKKIERCSLGILSIKFERIRIRHRVIVRILVGGWRQRTLNYNKDNTSQSTPEFEIYRLFPFVHPTTSLLFFISSVLVISRSFDNTLEACCLRRASCMYSTASPSINSKFGSASGFVLKNSFALLNNPSNAFFPICPSCKNRLLTAQAVEGRLSLVANTR